MSALRFEGGDGDGDAVPSRNPGPRQDGRHAVAGWTDGLACVKLRIPAPRSSSRPQGRQRCCARPGAASRWGGGRQQRAKTPAAPQRCFQAAARLLLAHLCPSREGGEGGARLCSVPSADSEAGGRRMEPGPPGGCPRMKDRRRGRGGGRRGIFHRAQPPVRRFSPDTPAPPPRASSPRERSHMLSGCHRGDRSADKETGGLGGGGWGGGARCEAVGAASSPAETLGWRMGTTQRPHGGRVMGRGASSPCLSTPPPPEKQHFLGYVNARSRAPFRPRRPRGVGERERGEGGVGFAPRAERAAVPPARRDGNNGCGSP